MVKQLKDVKAPALCKVINGGAILYKENDNSVIFMTAAKFTFSKNTKVKIKISNNHNFTHHSGEKIIYGHIEVEGIEYGPNHTR